jgi:lipopolysaccharide transport system permease protein
VGCKDSTDIARLWAYREPFAILAGATRRSATCKTVSGVAWAIVRPFLAMTAFTVVFGRVAGLPTEGGARYPSGFLSGYCHNPCFRRSSARRRTSLVGNANLVDKVYFPRLIIRAWSAVVALVDFAINLAILFGLTVWYGFWPMLSISISAAPSAVSPT